jgi:hypothetical protein
MRMPVTLRYGDTQGIVGHPGARVKISHLVASRQQVVFALLVPSCQQV